jgi:valyl-tRNA synthetase
LCDWYLELSKPALQKGTPEQADATRYTLLTVLERTLRALHPFMPFITEEIWQRLREPLGRQEESIMIAPWPSPPAVDTEAVSDIEWLKAVLLGIRRIRAELDLSPTRPLPVQFQAGQERDRVLFERFEALLTALGRVESFTWLEPEEDSSKCAVALVDDLRVLIPLEGLVDVKAETARINRLLEKERRELEKSRGKLANHKFVDNAPEAVVTQERERLASHEATVEALEGQLRRLSRLGN